jgi:hypothetical protein
MNDKLTFTVATSMATSGFWYRSSLKMNPELTHLT